MTSMVKSFLILTIQRFLIVVIRELISAGGDPAARTDTTTWRLGWRQGTAARPPRTCVLLSRTFEKHFLQLRHLPQAFHVHLHTQSLQL